MARTNGKRQGAGAAVVANPEPRGSLLYEVLKGIDFERRELVGKKAGVGLFDLTKYQDGTLRCYACTLCERTCPVDCIDIEYCPEFPEGHWDVAAEKTAVAEAQPDIDMKALDAVIARLREGSGLIEALSATQAAYRYLPRRALEGIADEIGIKLGHVYGVATFYPQFSLRPVGKHVIEVCVGAACHVAGAPLVLEALSQELGIALDQTTDDMLFTLRAVNCVGACALAPVVRLTDGETLGHVTPSAARKLARKLRKSEEG